MINTQFVYVNQSLRDIFHNLLDLFLVKFSDKIDQASFWIVLEHNSDKFAIIQSKGVVAFQNIRVV